MKKWQFYVLSFTWGLPMTLLGCLVAAVLMIAGYKPQRFGWGWYFEVLNNGGNFNLGIVSVMSKQPSVDILFHEAGHGIQNCYFGIFEPIIALMSVARYWYREYLHCVKGVAWADMTPYDSIWFERQATVLGTTFLKEKN